MERGVDEPGPDLVTIVSPSFCISVLTLETRISLTSNVIKEVKTTIPSTTQYVKQNFGKRGQAWQHVKSVDTKTAR